MTQPYLPEGHQLLKFRVTLTTLEGEQQLLPREVVDQLAEERDDLRRALALINAWRLDQPRSDELDAILASVGEDRQKGMSVRDIVRQFRDGRIQDAKQVL